MKRMVWTSVFTLLVTGIVLTVAFIYLVGGYFVDLGLRRGSAEDPFAPPAVFRSAFEGNGSALSPAARPDFSGEDWQLVSFDGLKLEATHFSPAKSSHQWGLFSCMAMAVISSMAGIMRPSICGTVMKS